MDRLTVLLLALSRRERAMLAILFGAVLPLGVLFLWVLPLAGMLRSAEAELTDALLTRRWVAARAVEARALGPRGAEPIAIAPVGISGIEQSLVDAALRTLASTLANRDRAAIELGFDSVEFDRIAGWLAGSVPALGYRVSSFRFESAGMPGLVAAEIVLEPGP